MRSQERVSEIARRSGIDRSATSWGRVQESRSSILHGPQTFFALPVAQFLRRSGRADWRVHGASTFSGVIWNHSGFWSTGETWRHRQDIRLGRSTWLVSALTSSAFGCAGGWPDAVERRVGDEYFEALGRGCCLRSGGFAGEERSGEGAGVCEGGAGDGSEGG